MRPAGRPVRAGGRAGGGRAGEQITASKAQQAMSPPMPAPTTCHYHQSMIFIQKPIGNITKHFPRWLFDNPRPTEQQLIINPHNHPKPIHIQSKIIHELYTNDSNTLSILYAMNIYCIRCRQCVYVSVYVYTYCTQCAQRIQCTQCMHCVHFLHWGIESNYM